jgi:hypothetical protein
VGCLLWSSQSCPLLSPRITLTSLVHQPSFITADSLSASPSLYTLARLVSRLTSSSQAGASEEGEIFMNWKSKLIVGILTAIAMFLLTFLLPRGGPVRDAALAQFPLTVGVWAIFVLLFVKLK